MTQPFQLIPEYRDYVWGGQMLRPGERTAEAWVIYEQDRIANGPLAGKTLLEAVQSLGASLLGSRLAGADLERFPLLVKLLDCADWLSLQVHPNDEQAVRLEGPGHFGKTEAWYILEAGEDAELLFGLKPGISSAELEQAVRGGTVLDVVQRHAVQTGDTVFIRPGMLHALGPGLLLYEVQQTSNITYRVWDWNRPASAGRKLHIEQSLDVLDPSAEAAVLPEPQLDEGQRAELVECPYFRLELIRAGGQTLNMSTEGQTFHLLTVTDGKANLSGSGWAFSMGRYDSLVVPADCGEYSIEASSDALVLWAYIPPAAD